MFKLFKLNDDKYVVLFTTGRLVEGNAERVIKTLLIDGIEDEEIARGLAALEHDDVSDYGMNGRFIFSKKLAA